MHSVSNDTDVNTALGFITCEAALMQYIQRRTDKLCSNEE